MLIAVVLTLVMAGTLTGWLVTRRPDRRARNVIYLGYDDKDNVGSMRAAMLDRLKRGELDPL